MWYDFHITESQIAKSKMNSRYIQYSIFDLLDRTPLNDRIAEIISCDEDRLLNACAESVRNFADMDKQQPYVLSCSCGKDSHVLLAIYILYLKLGYDPLNLVVRFADTELEHPSLYEAVQAIQAYCQKMSVPFEIVKGTHSYWYLQFAYGLPVPSHFNRWCTGKLEVQPMQPSRKVKAITGRHFGESSARDHRLRKSCGTDTCGTDLIKDKYDPLIHWTNCLIWDAIYHFEGKLLYDGCFDQLKAQYEIAGETKKGSLRMGCFMCPVIARSTIAKNLESGLIDPVGVEIRDLLDELREARRIANPRTKKAGALYIGDRRIFWERLNKKYLVEQGFLQEADWLTISENLESDYSYPKTYTREWINEQHRLLIVP